MKYPRHPVMRTTRNLPMKRMNAPTQLMTPTRTTLERRRVNTFLQEVQKLLPLNAAVEEKVLCYTWGEGNGRCDSKLVATAQMLVASQVRQ